MPRRITLPKDVRSFQKTSPNGSNLMRSSGPRAVLPKGFPVDIGEPVTLIYDHKDQIVVPVLERGHVMCYVIVNELGLPELFN